MNKRPGKSSSNSRKKKIKLIRKAGKAIDQIKDIGATGALLSVPVYEFLYW